MRSTFRLVTTDSMSYSAATTRYDFTPYARSGRTGLKLPKISQGLWHNFGDVAALESAPFSKDELKQVDEAYAL